MNVPKWFKILWWGLLLLGFSLLVCSRLVDIGAGRATAVDGLLLVLWLGLLLAPLYNEVNVFGFKLKYELSKIREELAGIQNDVRSSIEMRTQISPVINFPAPPSDTQLPELEVRIRNTLDEILATYGASKGALDHEKQKVDEDVMTLFRARYELEKELRRVWEARLLSEAPRHPISVIEIIRTLSGQGLLDHQLAAIARQVYAVASPAIHGMPATSAQVLFVKDVLPRLLSALRAIQ